MPYCIYLRKSRADAEAEAHGEGETLARHEKALLELARRQCLNVTQIYREIVSGETIATRPVMQQLLSDVEQGLWEGVLVMEVERLARGDTMDQGLVSQTFKYSDTRIITPAKTYDPNNEFDEEYFEFGLFMSRREYKTINRRLHQGRLASVKEGKYVGNVAPYGYRRIKLANDKGFTLEPEPSEADVVKLIFDLYTIGDKKPDGTLDRLGASRIASRLNELQIPPRKKSHWVAATIRGILSNPVYIGKVRWNCRKSKKKLVSGVSTFTRPRTPLEQCTIVDGLHPSLISEETFNTAIDITKNQPPIPLGSKNTIQNPLCSLIVCSECGRRMVRRPAGKRQKTDIIMCPDPQCKTVSSLLPIVEKTLLDALHNWCTEYKLDRAPSQSVVSADITSITAKEKTLANLEQESEKLKLQFDNLHDLLEQGIYDAETFLDRSKLLSARMKKNDDDKNALSKSISEDRKRFSAQYEIIPKIEKLLEVYPNLSNAQEKNEMLREVLEKAIYTKSRRGNRAGAHDAFSLVLYPLLPTKN